MNLWQSNKPSAAALASTQPFCIDTLSFPQWLQFIFLPRMQAIIETGAALPSKCGIAPLAEEYFKTQPDDPQRLIHLLITVDQLLAQD